MLKRFTIIYFIVIASTLYSQKKELRKLSPDRPHQTESPITVDKGHVMLETDFVNFTKTTEPLYSRSSTGVGFFNLKFGLSNRMDIGVVSGSYAQHKYTDLPTLNKKEYLSDFTFRYKINLCGNDSGNYAVALMPVINTTDFFKEDFKINYTGLLVNFETELAGKYGLGYTGGLNSLTFNQGHKNYELFSTLSIDYKVKGVLRHFLEVSYRYNPDADYTHTYSIDSGITFTPYKNLQFDTGFYYYLPAFRPFLFVGGTIRI